MPVFYTPAQTVPAKAGNSCFSRIDRYRSQKEPFDRLSIRRRRLLNCMNRPYFNRFGILAIPRGTKLYAHISQSKLRGACRSLGTGLLIPSLGSSTTTRNVDRYSGPDRGTLEGSEQLLGFGNDVTVMLGPYQQIHARVTSLFVEQLEEIRGVL